MKNIIISLTSYPARIGIVHNTIESLLNQSLAADKIILWLAIEQFPNKENDLPPELLQLLNDRFEIQWCNDIRSFKKLIPTLKMYPTNIVITCDDDVIYNKDCVKLLYDAYKKDSKSIWCHRGHYVLFDINANIKPYKKWFHCIDTHKPSFNILQTGVGAVLYPPNCFHEDILKEDLFMNLSYDADDIWFWAMAVLNGTKVGIVKNNLASTNSYIENDNNALYLRNIEYGNDKVLKNILEYYPTVKQKLSKINQIFMILKTKTHIVVSILGIKFNWKIK